MSFDDDTAARFPFEIALLREMASRLDSFVPDMQRVVMARNPLFGQNSLDLIKLLRAAFYVSLKEAKPIIFWSYPYNHKQFEPKSDQALHEHVSPGIEAHRADWEREFRNR